MFLNDSELIRLLEQPKPVIDGLDLGQGKDRYAADAPAQPCSVDLHIGGIFIPGVEGAKPGSAKVPRDGLELKPGKTAVITTLEKCDFPSHIGGIGFPPNKVSAKGILMTNPGHVDPGYRGALKFTVINMGSEDYSLRRGTMIVSLLLFKLDTPAVKNLRQRGVEPTDSVEPLLAVLSPDFLDITNRVKAAAEAQEQVTRRVALWAPILIGILTVIGIILGSGFLLRGEISDLKARTDGTVNVQRLETRLKAVERELSQTGSRSPLAGEANGN